MTIERIACHGLGVIQPIDQLARDLDAATPKQPTFIVVGGVDPRIEQAGIEQELVRAVARGASIVYIGHSLGAALGFYLPQRYPKWPFKLIVTVDPTCWGSNADGSVQWSTTPSHPGRWLATGTYNRWINIRTQQYPGGGYLANPGAGTRSEDHLFADCDHIGVIADSRVRKIIFSAVQAI